VVVRWPIADGGDGPNGVNLDWWVEDPEEVNAIATGPVEVLAATGHQAWIVAAADVLGVPRNTVVPIEGMRAVVELAYLAPMLDACGLGSWSISSR